MKNGSQIPNWTQIDADTLDFDLDGLNNSIERQLGTNPTDYDTDGDGLGDLEERQINSEPLSVDSDGDGRSDLEERRSQTPPDIPTTAPENLKLREAYYSVAKSSLGWEKYPDCNWNTLYRELNGDSFTGKALDKEVLLTAMEKDIPPDKAIMLIAQSPYVQWHRHNAQVSDAQMIEYLQHTYSEATWERKQQTELFGQIQGESSVEMEIEKQ